MMALASSLVKEKQLESVCPHSLIICSDLNVAFPLCVRSLDSQVGSGLEMNIGGGNNSLNLGMGWEPDPTLIDFWFLTKNSE